MMPKYFRCTFLVLFAVDLNRDDDGLGVGISNSELQIVPTLIGTIIWEGNFSGFVNYLVM